MKIKEIWWRFLKYLMNTEVTVNPGKKTGGCDIHFRVGGDDRDA